VNWTTLTNYTNTDLTVQFSTRIRQARIKFTGPLRRDLKNWKWAKGQPVNQNSRRKIGSRSLLSSCPEEGAFCSDFPSPRSFLARREGSIALRRKRKSDLFERGVSGRRETRGVGNGCVHAR
jgi:hypothetical protein